MLPRATDSSTASRPVLGNPAKGKDMGTNNCPNNDCPAYIWLVYMGKRLMVLLTQQNFKAFRKIKKG
jgi:hypothetical protein